MAYISSGAPLFTHQYSHAWFDFRNRRTHSRTISRTRITATMAHRLFCLSLAPQFSDYSSDLWGVSSSDSVNGYVAWGGPPATGHSMAVSCHAQPPGRCRLFPRKTIHVLRWIRGQYPQAWQRYGFVDAFNPLTVGMTPT